MCKKELPVLPTITPLVLAGGLGTRLRDSVSDRPKVLAEVCGRPFLSFLLDQLTLAGFKKVILCVGYMANVVQDVFGDVYKSLHITYSKEKRLLGTGGALRLALPLITSERVMVMNGDSFIDADFDAFERWALKKAAACAVVLTQVSNTKQYGKVVSVNDGRIKSFKEKQESLGSGWINAGIYLLQKKLMEMIPSGKVCSLEREFFPKLVGRGLFGYRCNSQFIDIGTPESYAKADEFFRRTLNKEKGSCSGFE